MREIPSLETRAKNLEDRDRPIYRFADIFGRYQYRYIGIRKTGYWYRLIGIGYLLDRYWLYRYRYVIIVIMRVHINIMLLDMKRENIDKNNNKNNQQIHQNSNQ